MCLVTVRRLNRYKVIEIRWLSGIENFVREMILYSIRSETKPVKIFQNRSGVGILDNSSSKSILDVLPLVTPRPCPVSLMSPPVILS